MTSKTTNKYALEVRERTVRMVRERTVRMVRERTVQMVRDHGRDHASRWAAVVSIAGKIGCAAQTLHERVKQADAHDDQRPPGAMPL